MSNASLKEQLQALSLAPSSPTGTHDKGGRGKEKKSNFHKNPHGKTLKRHELHIKRLHAKLTIKMLQRS